jgi:hypothetical protein
VVNGYTFTGFLSPLSTPAQLLASATYSSYAGIQNYGSAVPFKWQLSFGGTAVTSTSTLASARVYANSSSNCRGPPAPTGVLVDSPRDFVVADLVPIIDKANCGKSFGAVEIG